MANKTSPNGGPICKGAVTAPSIYLPQDLLMVLADELDRVLPGRAEGYTLGARLSADAIKDDPTSPAAHQAAQDSLNELLEQLDEIARREGLTFDLDEDSESFGYWPRG